MDEFVKLKDGTLVHAQCTWGIGPDVLLDMYRNEGAESWFVDLTSEEAIQLANHLLVGARAAQRLDKSTEGYFVAREEKEKAPPAVKPEEPWNYNGQASY